MKNHSAKEYYSNLKKEQINCPVCDSSNYKVLANQDRYGMGLQSVICTNCSMIFINPRPTELEMNDFYKNHYRSFYESVEKPTSEYINNGPFIARANYVKNVLGNYLYNAKSVLDVGCAEGTLLLTIEKGFPNITTQGIEPSLSFGAYAKQQLKGEVFIGSYQEFIKKNNNRTFDVLTSTHVLEHILNPKEYLSELKKMMHNESVLYVEVPNIMDKRVNGLGAVHLGHVLSFDAFTLKRLLNDCGFEILEIFMDDLPAKTPAMAVICKVGNPINKKCSLSKKDIKNKESLFKERVLGENLNKSIISKIKKKLKLYVKSF